MSYTTIRLPTEFVKQMIDPCVDRKIGLDSRAAVIKDALRKYSQKSLESNEEKGVEN